MREAIASLSPRSRIVFRLHRVEGLDFEQIADRLGLSIADVERDLATALVQIAKTLDGRAAD